jgi:hypothetical protein
VLRGPARARRAAFRVLAAVTSRSRGGQRGAQVAQDLGRDCDAPGRLAPDDAADRAFDGPGVHAVHPLPARREPEEGAAAVGGIAHPIEEAVIHQPREHAGKGARVQVEQRRQLASGHARLPPNRANHQPLGPRDAQARPHPLGPRLQGMIERPEQAHELEGVGRRARVRRRHGASS